MNIALTIIAIVFAALRIGGVKSQAFQAFAHLFVGGLLGASFAQWNAKWNFESKWLLCLAVVLSLVELTVFLLGFFKTWFHGLA